MNEESIVAERRMKDLQEKYELVQKEATSSKARVGELEGTDRERQNIELFHLIAEERLRIAGSSDSEVQRAMQEAKHQREIVGFQGRTIR